VETEQNGKLPFLDILISRDENKMNTSVYRKKTFTDWVRTFIVLPILNNIN
jgi:hypothetical protein